MKAICFLLYFFAAHAAATEPYFWSDTETGLKKHISAPIGMIQYVLSGEDENDKSILHDCMRERNLKKGEEAALFIVAPLTLSSDFQKTYFVRPALQPYCSAFYGAHLFRYWFVTSTKEGNRAKYRILFKNGGDGVGVLSNITNGYRDLLLFNHDAVSQYWLTLAYDGHAYKEISCERKDFQEDGSLKTVACLKQ